MAVQIAPSVLACDFANIQREIEMLNRSACDYIHVDIMDGVFVPNISFGLPVTAAMHAHARKPLDVHLMIVNPDQYVAAFREAGAAIITVHAEACTHLHRSIQGIKQTGSQAGVALNPHTPVSFLEDIIEDIDLVCIMSVNPGFGGQKFIPRTYDKVRALKELIVKRGSQAKIEIDGGVQSGNAAALIEAGADILVAGSFVFQSEDPIATIAQLKALG
ncbi:ribulose-phosphate 3-epimerase [Nitritalea halalkaliphila LW7]|uniref:Ribulose-phosphate 3-epimerase n=1 Tax=Nitritalea halalkaliphila LW7 TaxID=1189621 RepID=I5C7P0_9BACT|nr:ribulose-phosphate 3-epimerase [Nitritalea halalkaliphila]EIM77842.1 ribulose-phosphate 3-epimerase [Nitritalea halalkaliphila LW7]